MYFVRGNVAVKIGVSFLMLFVVIANISVNKKFPKREVLEKNIGEDMKIDEKMTIRVEAIELSNVEKYNEEITKGIRQLGGRAKVVVVDALIENCTEEKGSVELYKFVLQNNVWSNGINPELFFVLNLKLSDLQFWLDGKGKINVKLPFVIYDFQIREEQWDDLKEEQFDLVISVYPIRRVIHM